MLIVMDKSLQGKNLSQHLQTKNKLYILSVTSLTGYKGIIMLLTKTTIFVS